MMSGWLESLDSETEGLEFSSGSIRDDKNGPFVYSRTTCQDVTHAGLAITAFYP
jgi:hypothetical protein